MIFVEKHICWNTDARYQELLEKKSSLAVVGLGYVGLPLAVAFARHFSVIGLDINREKIAQYRSGLDPTDEVGDEAIQSCSVQFIWKMRHPTRFGTEMGRHWNTGEESWRRRPGAQSR